MKDAHEEDFMILYKLADKPYQPKFSWTTAKKFTPEPLFSPREKKEYIETDLFGTDGKS